MSLKPFMKSEFPIQIAAADSIFIHPVLQNIFETVDDIN